MDDEKNQLEKFDDGENHEELPSDDMLDVDEKSNSIYDVSADADEELEEEDISESGELWQKTKQLDIEKPE